MIRHMRHGSPPRLLALQSILSPNRRESLPTPSAGVRIRSLFRKVGVGGRRYIPEDCRLGSRDSSLGPPLKLAAMRLVSGDLLVVATNTDPKSALAHYRRRWEIETRSSRLPRRAASISRIPTSFTPTGSASFSLCWP